MELPTKPMQVLENINMFVLLYGQTLPDFQRDKLVQVLAKNNPVSTIVNTGEILYSIREDLSSEGLEIGAQCTNIAANYGWFGPGNRGFDLTNSFRKSLGEIEETYDPEINPNFINPALVQEKKIPTS